MLSTIQRSSAINILAGDSWQPWRIGMIASRGEKLTKSERKILEPLTGRTTFPDQPVRRFTCCVGRIRRALPSAQGHRKKPLQDAWRRGRQRRAQGRAEWELATRAIHM